MADALIAVLALVPILAELVTGSAIVLSAVALLVGDGDEQ
jgi:hypothetical protein